MLMILKMILAKLQKITHGNMDITTNFMWNICFYTADLSFMKSRNAENS